MGLGKVKMVSWGERVGIDMESEYSSDLSKRRNISKVVRCSGTGL